MASSLRASTQGLEIVDRARKHKGWSRQACAWYETAHTSLATLKHFLQGKPVQQETFINICQAVGVKHWQEIVDSTNGCIPLSPPKPVTDWGEAPDVSVFYGRHEELTTLEQWIVSDRCRLIALLGMPGIGKTALCVKLVEQIQDDFEYVIWRSLRHAPFLNDLLSNLIQFLSPVPKTDLPEDTDGRISRLLENLRSHRCLLILDNVKAILRSGELAGHYREGYEGYGELLKRLGEERHQSCLVLIGREKPREIALLEGNDSPVRALQLIGLKNFEAREILISKGLSGEDKWETLIQLYRGNPLALKLISTTIQELFNGSVSQFIQYPTLVIGGLSNILEQHFERLSNSEKEVTYCLAIKREPISILKLQDNISSPLSQSELMEVLESLLRRSLIEKTRNEDEDESEVLFTLQPVVMKYITKYQLPPDLRP
ncbi:MAG: NB-ARC domain-containing protein [Cyanobacteriota bacterium]